VALMHRVGLLDLSAFPAEPTLTHSSAALRQSLKFRLATAHEVKFDGYRILARIEDGGFG
jgi:ATP-dependent DNA ligase